MKKNFKKTITQFLFTSIFFVSLSGTVSAAGLSILPLTNTGNVGDSITVKVSVNTEGEAINAGEGVMHFPSDLLSVSSISKSASIFSLWIEEPAFSNTEGTIRFNGGVPGPGFIGSNGEIFNVVFKTKKQGVAPLTFSDISVFRNDGLGTNVLTKKTEGSIQIGYSVPSVSNTPRTPKISSNTHPKESEWYKDNSVELSWKVPAGITALSYSVTKDKVSIPTKVYDPSIENKKVVLEDGMSYFNLRFKNEYGWSEVARFKIQIDTTVPDPFEILFKSSASNTDPQPVIGFISSDNVSGIKSYEIIVDDNLPIVLDANTLSSPVFYTLPPQDPGRHTLVVRSLDFAGNSFTANAHFTIGGLNIPLIDTYHSYIKEGGSLELSGTSYPSSTVELVIESPSSVEHTEKIKVETTGLFAFTSSHKLERGDYVFKIRAITQDGAKSAFSEPVLFNVYQPITLASIGKFIAKPSSLIALAIVLTFVLFSILVLLYKNWKARQKLKTCLANLSVPSTKTISLLSKDIGAMIKLLEKTQLKRKLTQTEEDLIETLKEDQVQAKKELGGTIEIKSKK